MSRIGKKPVALPSGVTATIDGQHVTVKGPKGELAHTLIDDVTIENGSDGLTIIPRHESKRSRAMWGLSRSLVSNLVTGVSAGYERRLEITGVGYRAAVAGKSLNLNLGFSHDVSMAIPEGITITTPRPTEIVIAGIDKQEVGQIAANIRRIRPPEPYKGKGVRYSDEKIFRKEGKKK